MPGQKTPSPLDVTPVAPTPTVIALAQANAALVSPTVTPTPLPTQTPVPTATVNPNSCYPLTVSTTPPGTGLVSAAPGPDCPTDLNLYRGGTVVTLGAVANSGSSFVGWSGDATGANASATVRIDGNKAVTATFTSPYAGQCFSLTASVTPAGGGSVSAGPAPDCPTDPTRYKPGTVVTLTAVQNGGWQFTGWSGDVAGPNLSATLTMNANRSVTASYMPVYTGPCFSLTTVVSPAGGGTVRAAPAPDCPDGTRYRAGTIVTLTAYPASGWVFQGWGGSASGAGASVTMTMDGSKSITTAFATPTATPTRTPGA